MKGLIKKTNGEWFVEYKMEVPTPIGHKSWWETLPLHPDDVEQIEKDAQVFDNIEARIACYPDVDFHEIEECPNYNGYHFGKDCSCKIGHITYAKLKTIQPTISDNFLIGPEGAFEWEEDGISDEEIEKAAKEYDRKSTRYGAKLIFIDAVNWYREQLKGK